MPAPARLRSALLVAAGLLAPPLAATRPAVAGPGEVLDFAKISHGSSGLALDDFDRFGGSVTRLGDLDGDGTLEIAVGAYADDDGPGVTQTGAVYVLSLDATGAVQRIGKISDTSGDLSAGNLGGVLQQGELFGIGIAAAPDLDGDGVRDLLVGTCDGDLNCGAEGSLFRLLLDSDGSVRGTPVRIENALPDHPLGSLDPDGGFGCAVAPIGDFDHNGAEDFAVGAWRSDRAGATDSGAIFLVYMANASTPLGARRLDAAQIGIDLAQDDRFGNAIASLGDIDGDGVVDLAVGARRDDGAGVDRGAVWILRLRPDGTLKAATKLGDATVGLGPLGDGDRFGSGVAPLGDLNGDGVPDLAVGAFGDATGEISRGAVWILFLAPDGSLAGAAPPVKIADGSGGIPSAAAGGPLDGDDHFGFSVAPLGDLNGDGVMDLLVGARQDGDGGARRGAAYVLLLDGEPPVCGNGVLDPVFEECDDGGTANLDGCSDGCRIEDFVTLLGAAAGGSVSLAIDGVEIGVSTAPGASSRDVLADLVAAIASDPTLQAAGVSAAADGDFLYTNGRYTQTSSAGDAGLGFGPGVLGIAGSTLEVAIGFGLPQSESFTVEQRVPVAPIPQLQLGPVPYFDLPSLDFDASGVIPSPFGATAYLTSLRYEIGSLSGLTCGRGSPAGLSLVDNSRPPGSGVLASLPGGGPSSWRCEGDRLPLSGLLRLQVLGADVPIPLDPVGGSGYLLDTTTGQYRNRVGGLPFTEANAAVHRLGSPFTFTAQGYDARAPELVGVLNLVTPIHIRNSLLELGSFGDVVGMARLSLRFVPEPGSLLSLGSCVGLLLLLGRSRSRRPPR